MIIVVRDASFSVDEPGEFRRLHAVVHGEIEQTGWPDGVRSADDGEHLWMDVDALAARLRAQRCDIDDDFFSMVDFARAHGFASPDGRSLRVHVEPLPN